MNAVAVIRQHLIDPEICIRCNTCEAICPVAAITHDDRNYVVDADKCNLCMACISPCPTGSIDNWRAMPRVRAYTPAEQLTWDELPAELSAEALAEAGVADGSAEQTAQSTAAALTPVAAQGSAQYGATLPPGRRRTLTPTCMAPRLPRSSSLPPSPVTCA